METIQNIIFDLGGVIFDIDYSLTVDAFRKLGIKDFDKLYTQLRQDRLFDELEMGLISPADFRKRMQSQSGITLSDQEIDQAWNAILIGLPEENIHALHVLKKKFRMFLLSNTNAIHELAFRQMIQNQYGEFVLDTIFEKIYLSHHIHMRKPDVRIFEKVILDNGLDPERTMFIDDSPQHVEGARKAGLQVRWFEKGMTISGLFSGNL